MYVKGRTMSESTPPKIEFPCPDYPIKVIGDADAELRSYTVTIMERHAPGFDQTKITVRDSSNGRYESITVFVTATGPEQLRAIFEDLKQSPTVKMVL